MLGKANVGVVNLSARRQGSPRTLVVPLVACAMYSGSYCALLDGVHEQASAYGQCLRFLNRYPAQGWVRQLEDQHRRELFSVTELMRGLRF